MTENKNSAPFQETLAIVDDQSWIWGFLNTRLAQLKIEYVRLPSTISIRQSWQRFKNARRIITLWENTHRRGGAIVEEIIEVDSRFDIADRLIVVTTNPTHEDVVYFSELGLKRIMRLRQREKDFARCGQELEQHIAAPPDRDEHEAAWRKIIRAIDNLPEDCEGSGTAQFVTKLDRYIETLGKPATGVTQTARYLDAKASIAMARGEYESAEKLWRTAIDRNPNYYRAYNNLIVFLQATKKFSDALALMDKMQTLNGQNISRLVGMGELHASIGDDERAEWMFNSALQRDGFCSRALNGLAELRFRHGDLDASRDLLARSTLAYRVAKSLNNQGIELVRGNKFEQALQLYTKAQFVLPQQEKGPLLFFNIAMCYSRWGKSDMAREFVRIALIKEPNYQKAKRLLEALDAGKEASIA